MIAIKPGGVRVAGVGDEAALMALCREMHAECAMFGAFDADKVRDSLLAATERTHGICGVIDDPAGGIVGALCMVLTTSWWSREHHWQDLFLYVRPPHRSAENFDKLVTWAKWFIDAMSPPDGDVRVPLCIGVMQPERALAKARLYAKDFQFVGGTFAYGETLKGRMEGSRGK